MRSYDQYCGLAQALDHAGDRWTLLIVRELLLGQKRFSDLASALPGIATNLLTARLRSLEADGLAQRVRAPAPGAPQVYELTDAGEGLRPAVMALIRWGGRWMAPRPPGLAFRPEWLALAITALAPPDSLSAAAVWEFVTEGHRARVRVGSGTVRSELASTDPPDLVISGEAGSILATAAGIRSLDDELAAGRLRLDGSNDARETFRLIATPAPAVDAARRSSS